MDVQIQRRPEAGQVWRHRNGAYYHVVAVANEEHRHEDHPVDVVYRSVRHDNGRPSHWWTRPLDKWHEKMTFVSERNEAVPPTGIVHQVAQRPECEGYGGYVQVVFPAGTYARDFGFQPGSKVRIYPTTSAEPEGACVDVCAANHQGHSFAPNGPQGESQCAYCGEPM